MDITSLQCDALKEIFNIGSGHAAKQLSMLLHQPIKILNTEVSIYSHKTFDKTELCDENEEISQAVYQSLSGDIDGEIILTVLKTDVPTFTKSVLAKAGELSEIEIKHFEKETLLEVGNIIISSCITAISKLLDYRVQLSIPSDYQGNGHDIIHNSLSRIADKNAIVIVMSTSLNPTDDNICGKLYIVLTAPSIRSLLNTLEIKVGENI